MAKAIAAEVAGWWKCPGAMMDDILALARRRVQFGGLTSLPLASPQVPMLNLSNPVAQVKLLGEALDSAVSPDAVCPGQAAHCSCVSPPGARLRIKPQVATIYPSQNWPFFGARLDYERLQRGLTPDCQEPPSPVRCALCNGRAIRIMDVALWSMLGGRESAAATEIAR